MFNSPRAHILCEENTSSQLANRLANLEKKYEDLKKISEQIRDERDMYIERCEQAEKMLADMKANAAALNDSEHANKYGYCNRCNCGLEYCICMEEAK